MPALPSGHVTFCFVDVVGSTRAFRAEPQHYPAALQEHHRRVAAAFTTAGGVIVEIEGDGIFAAFPDSAAAIGACLQAQIALNSPGWPGQLVLRSRTGLHAAEAAPVGNGYIALAVHQAARVCAAANGGQVLCTAAVAKGALERLPPDGTLAELGRYRLKDFDLPEPLFELRHPSLPAPFPPPRVARVTTGNLRLARTSFVGRDDEMTALRNLLSANRVITIVGPGGVGKTRLAYRLAGELTDSYPDGAWVVELEAVSGGELVVDAVARELPLPAMAGGKPADNVTGFLATKSLLLVLDNCEHVLDGAAEFVDHLLDAAPNVTILATSRTPLDIAGEVRFRLKPLTAAPANTPPHRMLDVDAVRLFVSRATAARTDFALTEANAEAVGEITRRLDGLPLALELAAARTTTYAPADLLARLDERFSLLSTSERGVSDRHRTLAATLAWSVELLSAHARTLLARVSIFAGRFALDWAEDVCAFDDLSGSDVALLIDALVRASLLAATAVGDRTDYELLRTVRVYASGQLRERNEQATMERRRAQFLVRRLAMPDPIFQFSSRTDAYLRAVSILADDVRAALDWCLSTGDGETACALIANVYRWWNVTGRIVELVPLALTALSLPAPPTFARLVTHYALQIGLETGGAEMSERRRYADDMLALAEQLDDDNARALALYCQADFPMAAGDFGAAEEIFASAAAAATRAGSASLAATIRRSEAEAHAGNDDDVLANSLDLVLDEFRRTDDPYGLAVTLAVLAGAELGCGRIADGAAHAAEGWRISDAHGYAEVGWRHWTLLARAAAERGAGPTAARLLGALDAALVRAGGAVGAGQGGTGDRERALCRARELLGPARMAELADEGRALTAEALTSVLHDALTQATGCAVRDSNPEPAD